MAGTLQALSGNGKREKVHDAQMVNKLPAAAKALVEAHAAEQGVSASAVVRWALGEYFEKRGIDS